MTVKQMSEQMDYSELLEWMAYDAVLVAEQEKAERLAKKGMRPR
jgi:hypothetical protein